MELANLCPACALHGNERHLEIAELVCRVGRREGVGLEVLVGNGVAACHFVDGHPTAVVVGAFEAPFLRSAVGPRTVVVGGEGVLLDGVSLTVGRLDSEPVAGEVAAFPLGVGLTVASLCRVFLRTFLPVVIDDTICLVEEFELGHLHEATLADDDLEVLIGSACCALVAEETLCVEVLLLNPGVLAEIGERHPSACAGVGSYSFVVRTVEQPFCN